MKYETMSASSEADGRDRGTWVSRLVLLLSFSLLLCALSLPVLAIGAEQPDEPAVESEASNPEELSAALRRGEAEIAEAEEHLEEELATPAAEEERERSKTEYVQVDASEAAELLNEKFGPSIEQLNEDPGRLLSTAEVEKVLGPNGALVSSPEEGREIVESSAPLVSSLGGEDSQPIDLTLERSGDSFSPANPTAPTELPATAEGTIELGEGIQVQMPASDDHEAVQTGQMSLFYPETEPTTDTMVAPVAGGVEIFDQLRSPESPEELSFEVDVPEGARLVANAGGGAEVLSSEGAVLEAVPAPTAVDAQGASVPTTMTVEGESLVLDVGLAAAEPAYPVLLDPEFLVENKNFGAWSWESSPGINWETEWTGSDLEVGSLGNGTYYPANVHGAFTTTSPGATAWIASGTFEPIYFYPNACGGNQPHGYIGLYNPSAGSFAKLLVWEGQTGTGGDRYDTGWGSTQGTTTAIFGVGTIGSGVTMSCRHQFYLGGYSLAEKDTTPPVITSVTGVPLGQWFDPEKVGPITVNAADTGYGVYELSMGNEGAVTNHARPEWCTGLYGSRCPHQVTWGPIMPAYERGKRAFHVWAMDAMGNGATPFSGETWTDPYKPEIELAGQFAKATEEVGHGDEGAHNPADENKLRLPTYELHIAAFDGSTTNPLEMESGVQRVQVFVDGKEQTLPWGVQTCPVSQSSCPLIGTFELKLPGLSMGVHKLKVVATDRVGHVREREIEFEYIPATGEGENQVLEHFPLPDGEAAPQEGEESSRPEVAVNVINGNLVFHQRDAEVASNDAALPVERFYNSELPAAQSGEFGKGWTMAQAPEIKVASPSEGTLIQGDGTVETGVPLPSQPGQVKFDPVTHASVEKSSQGYVVADESAEAEPSADVAASGLTSDLQGSAEATLDLQREGSGLSELVADDPGTAAGAAEQAGSESSLGYMFMAEAGGQTSARGNLSHPVGTATDSAGDVYVADAGHDRIQEFDKEGHFLRQWGGAGTGGGEFENIVGIAVGPSNDVYVAEPNRIQAFGPEGAGLFEIGAPGSYPEFSNLKGIAIDPQGDLFALEGSTQARTSSRLLAWKTGGGFVDTTIPTGTGAGQVKEPSGIAATEGGAKIWIADTGNYRIGEFTLTGQSVSLIREVGTIGYENGKFARPQGIAIDRSGNVWVADTGNGRVQEFTTNGGFLRKIGGPGAGPGEFSEPRGLAADASGNVWVADTRNDRIQELSTATEYVRQTGGANSEGGRLSRPVGTATDSSGDVYVADAGHDRIQEFDKEGVFLRQWGGAGSGGGEFENIVGIAVGPTNGYVYVAEPSALKAFGPAGGPIWTIGAPGTYPEFTNLKAVATDPQGDLFALEGPIASRSSARLLVWRANGGAFVDTTIPTGTGAGQLNEPSGIAATEGGAKIYIADTGNYRIGQFTLTGQSLSLTREIGSIGSENGKFARPRGVAVDRSGNVWVSDTGNGRVQELTSVGSFLRKIGGPGGGQGEFSEPLGLSADATGDVWVADTRNDRIQELSTSTIYVRQTGGANSEGGRLSRPVATATDSAGDVYVADAGHDRVQEFTKEGVFLRQWGGAGSGGGEFENIVGIATGPTNGYVYVAEPNALKAFGPAGGPISTIGAPGSYPEISNLKGIATDPQGDLFALEGPTQSRTSARLMVWRANGGAFVDTTIPTGSGAGQLKEPNGIDAIEGGAKIWIADTGNYRIGEFALSGQSLSPVREVGDIGYGPGEFARPQGVALEASGNVWIADTGNGRVQEFTGNGAPMTKFGRVGGEPGLMSAPRGLAVDASGNVWIANTADDRIDKWKPSEPQPLPPIEPAPAAEVESSAGLVRSIEGEPTGNIDYTYSSTRLTTVAGPESTTHYAYDGSGRLNKIELPHGTSAEVEYDTLGRVKKLKLRIEGGAVETTEFEYSGSPREAVVRRQAKPATHYSIGEDGSVLKWWNVPVPPEIEEPTGSLWAQRVETNGGAAITPGDQSLVIKAASPNGVASIQIIANGSQIVAEKSCEKEHAWECLTLERIYVTEAESWAPGILSLEAVVTDATGGQSSRRFSDNVPYIPPHGENDIEAPTFEEIRQFREEWGLDLDLKGNERGLDERIFNLIDVWHESNTPGAQVAQASWEKWGVPLRPTDIVELEYRERYIEQDATAIATWALENASNSYAGWSVENAAGGTVRVAFTSEQATHVAAMKSYFAGHGLIATDRIQPALSVPTHSLGDLYEMAGQLMSAPHGGTLESVSIDEEGDRIEVEAENTSAAEAWVTQHLGSGAPVQVIGGRSLQGASARVNAKRLRETPDGPLYAGQDIATTSYEEEVLWDISCTAGLGAREATGGSVGGKETYRTFVITAGHCGAKEHEGNWGRRAKFEGPPTTEFGTMARDSLPIVQDHFSTDVGAIAIHNGLAPPKEILPTNGAGLIPIQGIASVVKHEPLCLSGAASAKVIHGQAMGKTVFADIPKHDRRRENEEVWWAWMYEPVAVMGATTPGDSGGPIYRCGTGEVVGLMSATNEPYPSVFITPLRAPEAPAEPLYEYGPYFKPDQAPGILNAPGMGHLEIIHRPN